ncbi:MAG TPA: excinuclease ABC subunit UvrA [Candidatus Omnitrophica bacterium]|mgnify:CR=1 FL=1|nr:MAG: excinuclease ABC subunit UvrA [Candidatus Omnitrophota bacterium]RKY34344.1 MAG: excinuclease ABC subunit UvrA [Candidatus Omnitrophota bacterium]RKY44867.1 MAG: excinuclease ABC subunit UvrA [Candidatus Omnitrophota bacterium]HEC69697.1 excinuclease ABC subunit UvrA [Candidatus Omnitrophota bacterium]
MSKEIIIKGAREHNLKNIDLVLPRNKFIVITGLSGSGKSSLAFDTIYAEGQRRYVESLSSYARQFLEKLEKPQVEYIEGLSPAIAIEQRSSSGSLRSIVATQTEIYDYLRLLFARIGKPYCFKCKIPISAQSPQEIINRVLEYRGYKIYILAPLIKGKKGKFRELFQRLRKDGFIRVRIDGKIYNLEEDIDLARYKIHNIELVVDRLILKPEEKERISSSVELALKVGKGEMIIFREDTNSEDFFSSKLLCPKCKQSFPELEPRSFSFNSPYGACPACNGLGRKLEFDVDLIVPDKRKSLREGAIEVWRRGGRGYILYYRSLLRELAEELDFSLDTPFYKLPKKIQKIILYGSDVEIWGKPFEGVIPHLERIFETTDSDYLKVEISKFMSRKPCVECGGLRLRKESLSVYVKDKTIGDILRMSIGEAGEFFDNLKLTSQEEAIAHILIKEIKKRLRFCKEVGLDYLTLDRLSSTLSGGEAQRIRLATQVGSALSGVIYILDEPTIGLHPRDVQRLIEIFKKLRDLDNSIIVIEHDERVIKNSDWIVDLGPGAGKEGGFVVYNGPTSQIVEADSLTASYLREERTIPLPFKRRDYRNSPFILIKGARQYNLKNINVKIPLRTFICVTGVSGSGKSTLIEEILYKGMANYLYGSKQPVGACDDIKNKELIDKVIVVDQAPIGRTPRSNPATYTGVFTYIREFFSQLPEARARGFKPGRFSFNVKGGRCEACQGDGLKKIDMHFLPSVYVKCEVCQGKRFNEQTLEVKFKGYSIADVLEMSVDEAIRLFENIPQISNVLKTLQDVGLGYIELGQSATTLSGGEAQRVKLSKYLRKKSTGRTLYLLDEPTTGLHFEDVRRLLDVLQRIVDKGNTVVVIEHNLEVIKCADYIIDLGPEGGEEGGYLVACGSPEEVAKVKTSYTGRFLREKLEEKVF